MKKDFFLSWIIALLLFGASLSAKAGSLDEYMEKMKSVIEKDGRCEFAVAQVPSGDRKEQTMLWPKVVACLGDITVAAGTMNEKSGCGAFYFNPFTLKIDGVGSNGRMKIANGKKCVDGGLEEVMGLNLIGYVDEKAGSFNGVPNLDVGWVFYDGSRTDFMKPVVVYAKKALLGKSKYEDWWSQKRQIVIAKENEKIKKEKTVQISKKKKNQKIEPVYGE
ncbi:MAG TPA: hypothetical protein VF412_03190 [Bdellovibrio sp.]|uniref:hypothetical protein n=1 Tax=Bdellovibrio sp. TaxID=28201 RepID=UPI002F23CFE6